MPLGDSAQITPHWRQKWCSQKLCHLSTEIPHKCHKCHLRYSKMDKPKDWKKKSSPKNLIKVLNASHWFYILLNRDENLASLLEWEMCKVYGRYVLQSNYVLMNCWQFDARIESRKMWRIIHDWSCRNFRTIEVEERQKLAQLPHWKFIITERHESCDSFHLSNKMQLMVVGMFVWW